MNDWKEDGLSDQDESEAFESQLLTKTHRIGFFLILLMMGCHHGRKKKKKKTLIKNLHKML